MFEAVVTLCAAMADGPCRDALLPGYEADSLQACETALAADLAVGDARCQKAGKALDVTEIAPGVFVHLGQVALPGPENGGDMANMGFVIGTRAVAVIDTGSAAWMGEALYRAIRARSDLPVAHVILTHMHPDHVLGASVFAGAQVTGHPELPRALADRRETYLRNFERDIGAAAFLGTDTPRIDNAIKSGTLDLGDRVLELRAWPTAHTGTDLTVLDRQTGTLFTGDLVFDEHVPTMDGSLRGWQQVLGDLQAIGAAQVVPGHGGPALDWPDAALPVQRYLDALATDARNAIDAGERLGDAVGHIGAGEAAQWQLFDDFNPRNATIAFTELEWE
ncbi:quinoprotein relay system zinc metallohydrolase 2 [Paracoccus sp. (in: a-proteobacteria)]|uniref:quinoprotein relay system zinc metallohydrolase 2 n=1 Tax=Paracoccus sp. TaxID=267 RepID=UPI003A8C50F7